LTPIRAHRFGGWLRRDQERQGEVILTFRKCPDVRGLLIALMAPLFGLMAINARETVFCKPRRHGGMDTSAK
jgi:hypothetical protein